jgi:cardiolipin synthase
VVADETAYVYFDVPDGDVHTLMHSIAALTWGRVVEGNAVRIVQDTAFFDALFDDIERAAHHVHLETFLWENGRVSDRVVESLTQCARRGIETRVLVDHRGARTTSPAVWATLRDAGVDFRVYHRARLREIGFYNNRDHRKIAVIDNASATRSDTASRIRGTELARHRRATRRAGRARPAVGVLENWTKVTRRALAGPECFPHLEPAGTIAMHVAWAAPPETSTAVQRLYSLAIAAARREIILQNPYFIPDRHALRLYADAVRRGVRVRLMLRRPARATSRSCSTRVTTTTAAPRSRRDDLRIHAPDCTRK